MTRLCVVCYIESCCAFLGSRPLPHPAKALKALIPLVFQRKISGVGLTLYSKVSRLKICGVFFAESDSFYDTIGESISSPEYDNAVNNSLPGTPIDPEEKRRQEEEWKAELAKVRSISDSFADKSHTRTQYSGEDFVFGQLGFSMKAVPNWIVAHDLGGQMRHTHTHTDGLHLFK